MTEFFTEITGDLLNEIFTNNMLEVFVLTFLFAGGLTLFNTLRRSIT